MTCFMATTWYWSSTQVSYSGFQRWGETLVPIPNTPVKPSTADGSAATMPCESRLLPGLWPAFSERKKRVFCFIASEQTKKLSIYKREYSFQKNEVYHYKSKGVCERAEKLVLHEVFKANVAQANELGQCSRSLNLVRGHLQYYLLVGKNTMLHTDRLYRTYMTYIDLPIERVRTAHQAPSP